MIKTLSRDNEINNQTENKYISSPIDLITKTEFELYRIFEEEEKKQKSVLLEYKMSAVRRLAQFITCQVNRPASIGIAGETASGKSTITYDIIDTIEEFARNNKLGQLITRVNSDDYYYDRSEAVKKAGGMSEFAKSYDFDIPEALELNLMYKHIKELISGKPVMLPKYDMSGTTIRWDNHTPAIPSRVIISEGLFTLTEEIRDVFDFKIYVDVNSQVQKSRFYKRAQERGLGDGAHALYKNASEKADIYIRPCRDTADIVLSGEADRNSYKIFINRILNIIESFYISKQAVL